MGASQHIPSERFATLNAAYDQVFQPGRLSLGLVVPLEAYPHSAVPTMARATERAELAEALGFRALWLRDVPFNVPAFGDAGQVFDPFVYLGYLSASTSRIALGVASVVLPLRHPAHVAKAAASVDALSGGRLLLGVASGDRPEEYPAMNTPFHERGVRFRDSYNYMRALNSSAPRIDNSFGRISGEMELLPKPQGNLLPLLITGSSQQSPAWIAENGDGWMTYPRSLATQKQLIREYRNATSASGRGPKPVMEPLYVDLEADADAPVRPIHLGIAAGVNALRDYLLSRQAIGVNHIALNLRFNRADIEATLARLAEHIIPEFHD